MRHIVSVLVENKFGVLARIATLFAARGFNINSLSVNETNDPTISQMTIVVKGDASILEQVTKQLNKLVDVIKVINFKDKGYIERELVLIKINTPRSLREEIIKLVGLFNARIIDMSLDYITIEITAEEDKINTFIKMMLPYGIKDICSTGIIALNKEHANKTK
ncbi:MAG: acetolactate synthase small subunit [Endomicrobium sp.]|jgi:acetolactate synthase-1/3 small subunit|uniref:acetolactate synthase small subunit n=1 Tax=Candidatus Endomicrobiellum cubanum TaxID=3242325 RepID=UPI00281A0970|nr:acetolactate synthase small subunit [Endomicrobium sp.]MDR2395623.1 acetolactate synthase small subunit [Endomicrobium sp.]